MSRIRVHVARSLIIVVAVIVALTAGDVYLNHWQAVRLETIVGQVPLPPGASLVSDDCHTYGGRTGGMYVQRTYGNPGGLTWDSASIVKALQTAGYYPIDSKTYPPQSGTAVRNDQLWAQALKQPDEGDIEIARSDYPNAFIDYSWSASDLTVALFAGGLIFTGK